MGNNMASVAARTDNFMALFFSYGHSVGCGVKEYEIIQEKNEEW